MTPRVAIIGAGLAGLAAADRLLRRNVEVTLIDKGRRAGGRFCTRPVELPDRGTATFDLGPQVLYARRSGSAGEGRRIPDAQHRVYHLLEQLRGENPLASRAVGRIGGFGESASGAVSGARSITGGMRELAFRMLYPHRETIDFRDHTLAESLQRTEDGWKIQTRSLRDGLQATVTATALILTAPLPQALELLATSRVTLPDELAEQLRAVEYTRCFAVYGSFAGAGPLPDGGVWFGEGPFEWIADNHAKDVSDAAGAYTALSSPEWAAEHWDATDAVVLERLLPPLQLWVGEPVAGVPVALHRWRWARPVNPIATHCAAVRDLSLVLAGDGFAATMPDPADAALLSGDVAAQRVSGLLTALARADDRLTPAQATRVTLEIAVATPDEARRAAQGGADRLELSSALEVGGVTPSYGTFEAAHEAVELPVYVLLRPRPGGFCYTDAEFSAMLRDAEWFMASGARGLVCGVLTRDGAIDHLRCRRLATIANGRAVFHRAFDLLPDQFTALDELIDLGFERVLTSGGASTAEGGATRLAALVQHAGWQIEILPAGNIRPENVADLVRDTRCHQVHSSARSVRTDRALAAAPRMALGMGCDATGSRGETDLDTVARLRRELDLLAAPISSPV